MNSEADIDVIARAYLSSIAGSRVAASERDMNLAMRLLADLLGSNWNDCVTETSKDQFGSWGDAIYGGVKDLVLRGEGDSWHLLKRIVQLCPMDHGVLGTIGAGFFEDWVTEERLVSVRSELCALMANDPRWRIVLESSWDTPPTLIRLLAGSTEPERT